MKRKYYVQAPWHASIIFTIEAESKEEARELASNMDNPPLCSACTKWLEIDGGPDFITKGFRTWDVEEAD